MGTSVAPSVVLCIDDQEGPLMIRELILSRAGYKVLTATCGEDALELFQQNHIDLVISDHLLPGRTGCQVAEEMKQLKPRVPVILLSGLPEPPEGIEHADLFIVKGMTAPDFLALIARLLATRS